MRKNWYELTAGHANALIKIYNRVVEKNKNFVDVPKEIPMTKVEYTVYQKLHMHALIAKVKENGRVRKGCYLITKRGAQFLRGEIQIPKSVQTFRDRIVGKSEDFITINDLLQETPYWGDYENIKFEIADEQDLAEVPAVKRNTKRLKKGQTGCPNCGFALKKNATYVENKETNSVSITEEWQECPECGYNTRKTAA